MKEVIFLEPHFILPAGSSEALRYACDFLSKQGFSLATEPSQKVTHLLLPVPSFEPGGKLKGGTDLSTILNALPKGITIIGGGLSTPLLNEYETIDLLEDPDYLALNAKITAHCALALALNSLPFILDRQPVLVIGWGRIGKCLAMLLQAVGAQVTVAARKTQDRATIRSLNLNAVAIPQINSKDYRIIFNTAPEMILPNASCPYQFDLASKPGLGSQNVVWARGLPNKLAAESSGKLIAQRLEALLKGA